MSDRLVINDRPFTALEKEVRRVSGIDHYFIIDWMSLDAVEEFCEEGDFDGARDELENTIETLECFRRCLDKAIRHLIMTDYVDKREKENEGE